MDFQNMTVEDALELVNAGNDADDVAQALLEAAFNSMFKNPPVEDEAENKDA